MTKTHFAILACLIALTAGCAQSGRGHGRQKGIKKAQACDASEVSVGASVTCDLQSCPPDSTLFFETVNGQTFYLAPSGSDASVTFKVPAVVLGQGDIFCCAGDCDQKKVVLADPFTINALEHTEVDGGDGVIPPSDPGAQGACSSDADCIAGKKCEQGTCVQPALQCTSDTDCAAGEACQNGQCVTVTATPPPPAPEPDKIAVFTVEKVAEHLGLVKIHWELQGTTDISELNIYSSEFNRSMMDVWGNFCGDDGGKRYLLVNQDGTELNANAPSYAAVSGYLASAQRCNAPAPQNPSNCHDYNPIIPAFDLACRMDLKNSEGKFLRSGDIYTTVHEGGAVFHLYVKDAEGHEDSKPSAAVNFNAPVISNPHIDVLSTEKMIKVTADFSDSLGQSVDLPNCAVEAGNVNRQGSGMVTWKCDLTNVHQKFSIKASGVGLTNITTKTFSLDLSAPVVTLANGEPHCIQEPNNAMDAHDCRAQVALHWSVRRDWTVTDLEINQVVASGKNLPWIKSVNLYAEHPPFYIFEDDKGMSRSPKENTPQAFEDFQVTRTHTEYMWQLKGVDLDGSAFKSEPVTLDFTGDYQLAGPSHQSHADFKVLNGNNPVVTSQVTSMNHQLLSIAVNWEGQHLASANAECSDGGDQTNTIGITFDPALNKGQYNHQLGTMTVVRDIPGPFKVTIDENGHGHWAKVCKITCSVTAMTYNGTKINLDDAVSWDEYCAPHN